MSDAQELLTVRGLRKYHRAAAGTVHAVDGVDFGIATGEVLGLVGESGCGKSTLGRTLNGLDAPEAGSIRFRGAELVGLGRRALRPHRREMQMVFQDPFGSLNPRDSIGTILQDPLRVHGLGTRAERRETAAALLERVGLRAADLDRYPHEFSGGQRQRISIARAIALRPRLVICDEAVSALDVSIQAQIVNLLRSLQVEFGLSYLFISHDLAVVGYLSDRIAVMYLGRIVEIGSKASLLRQPRHPYTRALFSALPGRGGSRADRQALRGEPPSPLNPPQGCRFHPRCPIAVERCRVEVPAMRELGDAHAAACHLAA
ncbi:peptide/nickel transport system ATP-binding protein [Roseomonas rosea]|uniref:Peptide/nickel transport system ATP-binding protein n=1 Tax=Muricoccus roseus TaxID=198092 RepID=A0A1M6LUH6_9PROT|nr:oligopeptide/dipeptide ABC transporter ATP-binding protein [Roseomonas rosea]SHJ74803.1 peptide/nickel transport system ATP-binding protein [Roseomonas rosea]